MPVAVEPRHSTAEVVVHPSGKFLYGSNRGHDSLAVYAIEPGTGRLKLVEYQPTGGKTPRNFAVDPTGSYVLAENMGSDTIVVFRVDPETGALDPTGQVVEVPSRLLREVRPDREVTGRRGYRRGHPGCTQQPRSTARSRDAEVIPARFDFDYCPSRLPRRPGGLVPGTMIRSPGWI